MDESTGTSLTTIHDSRSPKSGNQHQELPETVRLSGALEYTISNSDGSIQGNIVDAVLGDDGKLEYVLVRLTQPAESADVQFLVPPLAATHDSARGIGTFDISEEDLARIPVFDEAGFQSGNSRVFSTAKAYWSEKLDLNVRVVQVLNPVLASALVGYRVTTDGNEKYTVIQDLIIDLETVEVTGAVLQQTEVLGAGELLAPMESLAINLREKTAYLSDVDTVLGTGGERGQNETTPEAESPVDGTTAGEADVQRAPVPVPEEDTTELESGTLGTTDESLDPDSDQLGSDGQQ